MNALQQSHDLLAFENETLKKRLTEVMQLAAEKQREVVELERKLKKVREVAA